MAPQRAYPRSSIRRIVKAHSSRSLSKNAEVLIFLNYTLFVQDLIREASMHLNQGRQLGIIADNVREVSEKSLKKFKC